jgi:hypothetical protein
MQNHADLLKEMMRLATNTGTDSDQTRAAGLQPVRLDQTRLEPDQRRIGSHVQRVLWRAVSVSELGQFAP